MADGSLAGSAQSGEGAAYAKNLDVSRMSSGEILMIADAMARDAELAEAEAADGRLMIAFDGSRAEALLPLVRSAEAEASALRVEIAVLMSQLTDRTIDGDGLRTNEAAGL